MMSMTPFMLRLVKMTGDSMSSLRGVDSVLLAPSEASEMRGLWESLISPGKTQDPNRTTGPLPERSFPVRNLKICDQSPGLEFGRPYGSILPHPWWWWELIGDRPHATAWQQLSAGTGFDLGSKGVAGSH
jgi:hypothetical protein